jgi:hypothetical protein
MGQHFTEVSPSAFDGVHAMRRTHSGIAYLKQTGLFKEYMQAYVDSKNKPFIAWDGEGWTDANGEHRYMLFQSSTGAHIDAPQLTSGECLSMMLRVAADNPKTIHVIYGGGYDATHILRDLPLELTAQLKDNNPIVWYYQHPVTGRRNRFVIKYLPHKWLQLSGFDWTTKRWLTVKIFDVMTFFQSSFIDALDSRNIAVPDIIRSGKANRSDFTYADIEEIRLYCQMELELLVVLCNRLRDEFDEAGLWVTQYHGPGAVASVVYKQFHVNKHMEPPLPHIEYAAQHAYFGGHFEQFKAGHYEGKVYLYDINSAYPYHIANLPSLAGAEWEYTSAYDSKAIGVWLVNYEDYTNNHIPSHPLPWRSAKGQVGFPTHNRQVWIWGPEAAYATKIHYGYILHPANDSLPFDFVPDLYRKRKQWQDEENGGERALKLALNSLYGKQAQRIGANPLRNGGRPAWHQLEWAGMVTSGTRAQILAAIAQKPESVISVETDSIMTTEPLNLPTGTALGEWGLKEYDWVTYIQSGIYFTSDGLGHTKSKTRGIDTRELHHEDVIRFLNSDQTEPLLVSDRKFIGLGNPRTYLYGQWQDGVKEVRVAGQKRIHSPIHCAACHKGLKMGEHLHDLIAAPNFGNAPSAPHPLPWIDGGVINGTSEDLSYIGDAVADYESGRHT